MFNWHKKESPLLGSLGLGGGIGSKTFVGETGPTWEVSLLASRTTSGNSYPSVSQKRDGSRIFISQSNNSIVYSDNDGSSWSGVNGFAQGIYGTRIYTFANTNKMVAATNGSNYGKIYYSSDNGANWSVKVDTNDGILAGYHNPDTGLIMIGDRGATGSPTSDLNRSTDFGNSWSVALDSNQSDHLGPGVVQNGSGSGLTGFTWSNSLFWTTSNSGASWSSQTAPTNHVFSSGSGVWYKSDNSIFIYKGNNQTVLTGTTPTGARTVVDLSSTITGNIITMEKDADDVFYLGTTQGYLYYSKDDGTTWDSVPGWDDVYDNFGTGALTDIHTDNANNRFLVVTSEGSSVTKVWSLTKI
jgi:hypothetical protein